MIPSSPRLLAAAIEPLEHRIAPATIFVGDNSRNDTEYAEPPGQPGTQDDPGFTTPFVNTLTAAAANDPIALAIGADANTFYVKLGAGDRIVLFGEQPGGQGQGYSNFITGPDGAPLKGNVVAIFVDKPHLDPLTNTIIPPNNEVDADELTGLSLGQNARVQVSGSVFGDVVANYNDAAGKIGGSGESGGAATELLNNSIAFFGANAVAGKLMAGGSIKSVKITGGVNSILTGTAAAGMSYDFNEALADGGDTISAQAGPGPGQAGSSISDVTIGNLGVATTDPADLARIGVIRASDGGSSAAGGKVSNVVIISDTNGYTIQGGAGGGGGGGGKGGAGGSVTGILANGLAENTFDNTPNDPVRILGGVGGAGGGKGGDVSNIAIGYEGSINAPKRSVNSIADEVTLRAGDGGAGGVGGKGGNLKNDKVFAAPTATDPLDPLTYHNITLQAGAGGATTGAGGKAGVGGSVQGADIRNPDITAAGQTSKGIVIAGSGGDTTLGGNGANGGSVKGATFVTFGATVTAGNGSGGSIGGKGGSVSGVLFSSGFEGVRAQSVIVDAGGGGTGTAGKGGAGGKVSGVTAREAELAQFDVNQTAGAANGGNSAAGKGAAGGSILDLTVDDVDSFTPLDAVIRVRAGNGGDASTASTGGGTGGKGGSVSGRSTITAFHASLDLHAGNGGGAPLAGNGGKGGQVSGIAFLSSGVLSTGAPTATLAGGNGGAAPGGSGGAGGAVNTQNLQVDGTITVTGGAGGAGSATSGAAGAGGKLSALALQALGGDAIVTAGSGGATGAANKKGSGGSITNANILAFDNITVQSGNGTNGGAGGKITGLGIADPTQIAGPATSVSVIAGNGSGSGKVAGGGGSISDIEGFAAIAGATLVKAGTGGAGTTKAAAGGSISDVTFKGGGGLGAEIRIEAGDATAAATAKVGGKGGNVSGVTLGLNQFDPNATSPDPFALDAATIVRHVSAGNGGDAPAGTGGVGGSVNDLRVQHDIGVRSGEGFGYNTMGGIFAGAGGLGGTLGNPGNVTNISANSIASIVAGKPLNGDAITARNLAGTVSNIILNGSVATIVDGTGTYLNYDIANFVGAVVNPAAVGVPYFDSDPTTVDPVMHPHANTFDLVNGEFVDTNGDGEFGVGDQTTAATDGFVAAIRFLNVKGAINNVRPEAVLTTNDAGGFVFIDLNNTNGQKVIA